MLRELIQHGESRRDHAAETVPPFYDTKPVRWVISIDSKGDPLATPQLESLQSENSKRGIPLVIPSITKTSGTAANIGIDTVEYVLGWATPDSTANPKPDNITKRHQAFIDLNRYWARNDSTGTAAAIAAFYQKGHHHDIPQPLKPPAQWKEPDKPEPLWSRNDLVIFEVDGDYACDSTSAQQTWAKIALQRKSSGRRGICATCAEHTELLETIPLQLPLRLVPGATNRAALISVNERTHGFRLSTGLRFTPTCSHCGLAVMNALTALLSDPQHRIYTGDSTLIWWTNTHHLTGIDAIRDPSEHLEDVADLMASVAKPPQHPPQATDLGRFYSAIIKGHSARAMVQKWVDRPLETVQRAVGHWFRDIESHGQTGRYYPSLGALALCTGVYRRRETKAGKVRGEYDKFGAPGADRPPKAQQALLEVALFGKRFPPKLEQHLINRIRRDRHVDGLRIALLTVAARHRHRTHSPTQEPAVTLDDTQNNPSFLAGRLFALYEYTQWKANNPIKSAETSAVNTTFKDRYFSSAVINPMVACNAGERMSERSWIKRLQRANAGAAIWIQQQRTQLYNTIREHGGMPKKPGIDQQNAFIHGYHYQRQQHTNPDHTSTSTNKTAKEQ